MLKRTVAGIIFALIAVAILIANNQLFDSIVITALAIIGTYEFFKAFKNIGIRPISWVGYLGCLVILMMGGYIEEEYKILIMKIVIPLILISTFVYIILARIKRTIIDVAITTFALVYIPFLFSFLKLILNMENGRILIWYVLFGAFASDTFAYIIGSKFGKTKLCPDISPNKTVEGAIGGVIGVILFYTIFTIIINRYLMVQLNVYYFVFVAIVASISGQFGDLTASGIKRYCKIKDFGKLIPGHGGILDRFDSVMFVAPMVYIFIKLYI